MVGVDRPAVAGALLDPDPDPEPVGRGPEMIFLVIAFPTMGPLEAPPCPPKKSIMIAVYRRSDEGTSDPTCGLLSGGE